MKVTKPHTTSSDQVTGIETVLVELVKVRKKTGYIARLAVGMLNEVV